MPSPSIATISPRDCSDSTMISLCSGVTRLKAWVRPMRSIAIGSGQRVQLSPVQAAIGGAEQTELAADALGCQPLIASQHHRPQTGRAKPRDCLLDAGRRRIGEADEADEGQPAKCVLPRGAHAAAGDRQHAQSGTREPIVHGNERVALLVIERQLAFGSC